MAENLDTNLGEPIYQVKLLSALRSGDPVLIHPFLSEIGKDRRKSAEGDLNTGSAALHLAVRCASAETVALLLSHRAISPNGVHPPGSGTTPLHLAASLGRLDIVNILLEQELINDALLDAHDRTCKDVARGKDIIRAIEDSRSFLNASFRSLLRSYILSPLSEPPSPSLLSLLDSPRVRFVNISYLDDDSGTSLLHEAARRKDLRLIELAVRGGADVFLRNRRGKMAYESVGKDDRVRVFLRQFANHDTTLIQTPVSDPPALKGYLNKYTNVAKGYNTRWFVLKAGVLSYYRHQDDETVASRGSISMKTAVLKISPGVDRLRFEVHSTPSRHHSGSQKWYMKANHPVEASRWTQAIGKSIEWYKRENGTTDGESRRKSGESDSSAIKPIPSTHSYKSSFSGTLLRRKKQPETSLSEHDSLGSEQGTRHEGEQPADASPDLNQKEERADDADEEGGENDDSSAAESTRQTPPHESGFELHGNSTAAQMELTSQLLNNLVLPSDASQRSNELRVALKDSFAMVQGMLNEYVQMVKEREDWWKKRLHRERERQNVWEESLAAVVREGETLERELRMRSRKRGSRFFDSGGGSEGMGTIKPRLSVMRVPTATTVVEEMSPQDQEPPTPVRPSISAAEPGKYPPPRTQTQETITSRTLAGSEMVQPTADEEPEEVYDTDEEDEFFDAIESNTLPGLIIPESLASPRYAENLTMFDAKPYSGYRTLRERLNLSQERPSTSLWSVLKHSIGKDLTKISFPVFFNEPTSMLQRMAEDMEFSECLDTAAGDRDPLRRIAFVAAFAMSNYSSTIGRIAKPFNPMLSETFEYVRLDRQYRYLSEQVSHHPPISACWAESPTWNYYGEVDAQNKFMGKSFEIRPTGVAHAELLIPQEYAPGYPRASGSAGVGKVVEHYSWKKVTTNVSGFILGSPTIDHYGDMVITNHRTGDQCILTFKPRGWRGRDAFEISGQVIDSRDRVAYEIAGRWNSQLVARRPGTGSGFLHPDIAIDGPHAPPSNGQEFFLLWRNSEKPAGSPFNLTPFAITLNDCPAETLKPYLAPTDCRLRPDQRAFELGKYEFANDLKNAQEEKQRATRRAREEGRMPPHKPRWFTAETDGDTGERVWTPSRIGDMLEYWVEREKGWKSGGKGRIEWPGVDSIFIDEPDFD